MCVRNTKASATMESELPRHPMLQEWNTISEHQYIYLEDLRRVRGKTWISVAHLMDSWLQTEETSLTSARFRCFYQKVVGDKTCRNLASTLPRFLQFTTVQHLLITDTLLTLKNFMWHSLSHAPNNKGAQLFRFPCKVPPTSLRSNQNSE